MWWELVMQNPGTGEEKLTKDCGYQLMPMLLVEVIKASNRPAAAMESMRNGLIHALNNGFQRMIAVSAQVAQLVKDETPALPKAED